MTTTNGSHRTEPSTTANEREMLDGWLDYHRATLAWKCEGLGDEELGRTALAPSELSLMGLVRHMAEVERYWFREIMLGEDLPELYSTREDPDGDFRIGPGTHGPRPNRPGGPRSSWRSGPRRAARWTCSRIPRATAAARRSACAGSTRT